MSRDGYNGKSALEGVHEIFVESFKAFGWKLDDIQLDEELERIP